MPRGRARPPRSPTTPDPLLALQRELDRRRCTADDLRRVVGRCWGSSAPVEPSLGPRFTAAFREAFGWDPPVEIAIWMEAEAAARGRTLEEVGGWLLGPELGGDGGCTERRLRNGSYFARLDGPSSFALISELTTGWFGFGMHAGGDFARVDLNPSPTGLAEVAVYDHEADSAPVRIASITELLLDQLAVPVRSTPLGKRPQRARIPGLSTLLDAGAASIEPAAIATTGRTSSRCCLRARSSRARREIACTTRAARR